MICRNERENSSLPELGREEFSVFACGKMRVVKRMLLHDARPLGVGALLVAVLLVFLLFNMGTASAQPPFPIIYEGTATIGDQPAPDGTLITARVGEAESRSVEVKDGRYRSLLADPSTVYSNIEDAVGLTIEFFADGVKAVETEVFVEGQFLEAELDLHFPELPSTGDDKFGLMWMVLGGIGAVSTLLGVLLLKLWPRRPAQG